MLFLHLTLFWCNSTSSLATWRSVSVLASGNCLTVSHANMVSSGTTTRYFVDVTTTESVEPQALSKSPVPRTTAILI